jgi:hypothetical protein
MKPADIPRPPSYRRLRGSQREKPIRDRCKRLFSLDAGALVWAHRPRTGKPVVGRLFEGAQYVQVSGVDVAVDEIVELLTPREHAKGYMALDGTLLDYCRQAFRLDETKTVLLHNKPVEFKGYYGGKALRPAGEPVVGCVTRGKRYVSSVRGVKLCIDEIIAALAADGDQYVFAPTPPARDEPALRVASTSPRSCITGAHTVWGRMRQRLMRLHLILGRLRGSEGQHARSNRLRSPAASDQM